MRSLIATLLVLVLACCWHAALAAAPPRLEVPDGQLALPGGRIHPNLLLNLSVTFADAGAAYRTGYDRALDYIGYFNPRMCYSYPMKRRAGGAMQPDLDERSGYFLIARPADARHECGGDTFSGNFLNWASASTLDLLRYGLTGGDRVIDEPGLTVLQRAWLPDGRFHPDFYASPIHFPRKSTTAEGGGSAPGRVTPFDADTLYVVSCRNRILFSSTRKGSNCDAPRHGASGRRLVSDKYFGEFNARVRVCSEADSASRPDLCRHYPVGFKPEGVIQQYSAAARIGVMSYLTEQGADDSNLYGGVLRAPLKFVGAARFDPPLFARAANAQTEWSADSGVLVANPDRAHGAASGAVNYINQLGRAQADRMGAYKGADPGAELYYEGLRYLQGRDAGAGQASTADAGFPVWGTRADPILAACQRNAVATIGHPSFVDDRYLPGNTRGGKKDGTRAVDTFAPSAPFDVMEAAGRIGAMEADSAGNYRNRAPRPDLLDLANMDDGDGGAGSYYLAAAAWWAHTHAIRPDRAVRVDSYSLELGAAQKAGASPLYLAAKYGAFDDRNGDANPFITSANRVGESEWSLDGGTPAAYFPAPGGGAIVGAVRSLFAAAVAGQARQAGRSAAVIGQGAAGFVLDSSFEQSGWSGRLEQRPLSVVGSTVDVGAAPLWEAGVLLTGDPDKSLAPRPSPRERKIYTLVRKPDQSTRTVPFTWDSLPREEHAYLDLAPYSELRDGLGEARVAFLRGERTREIGQPGGVFRRRAGILGDTIHSLPLLVGPPSASVQGAGYDAFHARYRSRPGTIYLGANDGMLHAFDARDGAELFAYVPNALIPALGELADPAYRHRPYVDASAGQGEAMLDGRWRSVLVSGMGMGARGVFALDVSDPAAFEAGIGALWEFTEQDDPAIGYVSSAPLVARIKVGMKGKLPEYRHFAVVSSGVNNYEQDAMHADAGGALFLLALDKPPAARWRQGVNYYKLAAPASEPGLANALGAPALVTAADGSARFAYAGDLQGKLWRFDFSVKPPFASQFIYEARDDGGQRQPITHAPRVVFAPGGGYLVLFGTGKLLEDADLQPPNFAPQSFYAIRDGAASPPLPVAGRRELAPRTLSGAADYTIKGAEFDYIGSGAKKGWYFDFAQAQVDGERAGASPVLASGTIFVNTIVPGSDACAAAATRTYVLDALSGFAFRSDGVAASAATTGHLEKAAAGALPLVLELGASSALRGATGGAGATRTMGVLHLPGDKAGPSMQQVEVRLPARRISWREVSNWQELHDAATK